MVDPRDDRLPALHTRRTRPIDGAIDEARRELWRAFQHGTLNEEEFASTLDRLEFDYGLQDAAARQRRPASGS